MFNQFLQTYNNKHNWYNTQIQIFYTDCMVLMYLNLNGYSHEEGTYVLEADPYIALNPCPVFFKSHRVGKLSP